MKSKKQIVGLLVVLIIVASMIVVACAGPAPPAPPPEEVAPAPPPEEVAPAPPPEEVAPAPDKYGGVLRITIQRGPTSGLGFPPGIIAGDAASAAPVFEALMSQDVEGLPLPNLAKAWEFSPDFMSVTFTLRKGVKFHDGTDFNAQAAKWNMDKTMVAPARRTTAALWKSIEMLDKYTIRLNLKSYKNTLLNHLAGTTGMMSSPTAYENNGEDWATWHPVGTGPFKFVSFKRDVNCVYERFDDYWREGKPYLDGIEYIYIADPMTMASAMQAGEVDVMIGGGPLAIVAADLRDKGFNIIAAPTQRISLAPDAANPGSIYANKTVREAIEYAIDREAIVKAVGHGFMHAMDQYAPPQSYAYNPARPGRPYDPNKAKQLLAEAGYPDGFQTKILALTVAGKEPVVAIQGYLQEVGIEADVEFWEPGRFQKAVHEGWHDALLVAGGAVHPNFAYILERVMDPKSPAFVSVLKPPEFGDILSRALTETDREKHKKLTQDAVGFIQDGVLHIPLWSSDWIHVLDKSVHDTGFHEGYWLHWKPWNAWLSK